MPNWSWSIALFFIFIFFFKFFLKSQNASKNIDMRNSKRCPGLNLCQKVKLSLKFYGVSFGFKFWFVLLHKQVRKIFLNVYHMFWLVRSEIITKYWKCNFFGPNSSRNYWIFVVSYSVANCKTLQIFSNSAMISAKKVAFSVFCNYLAPY